MLLPKVISNGCLDVQEQILTFLDFTLLIQHSFLDTYSLLYYVHLSTALHILKQKKQKNCPDYTEN